MSSTGARTAMGIRDGTSVLIDLLMGIDRDRKHTARQKSQDEIAAQERAATADFRAKTLAGQDADRNMRIENERVEREMSGYVDPSFRSAPSVPSRNLNVPTPKPGMAAGTPDLAAMIGEFAKPETAAPAMMGGKPKFELMPEMVLSLGGYDPSRDVKRQTELEQIHARSQPTAFDREKFDAEQSHRDRMADIAQQNANTAASRPVALRVDPNTAKLAQVEPVRQSLRNYGDLTAQFMALGPAERAAAIAGKGNQDLVGRLESARSGTLLQMKNLAELGVLTGPDVQIVQDLIGDPLSGRSLLRDPEYVTSRLAEAQAFIDGKAQAVGGVARVPPAVQSPETPSVMLDPTNEARLQALKAQGWPGR